MLFFFIRSFNPSCNYGFAGYKLFSAPNPFRFTDRDCQSQIGEVQNPESAKASLSRQLMWDSGNM